MDWLRKLINPEKGRNKWLETLTIIGIVGIILLIAASTLLGKKTEGGNISPGTGANGGTAKEQIASTDSLEKQMEDILSQIGGAGKVSVMISYSSGKEIIPASDIKKSESSTGEKDTQGGSRNIIQNQYESKIIYEEQGGIKKPIVLKEVTPQVKGVVVAAEGAGDPGVQERLCRAVQVLVDIPLHKIQVFEKIKGVSK